MLSVLLTDYDLLQRILRFWGSLTDDNIITWGTTEGKLAVDLKNQEITSKYNLACFCPEFLAMIILTRGYTLLVQN